MGEEYVNQKLLAEGNMKAAEQPYAGNGKYQIGHARLLFYVASMVVLLPMSVFSLCLGGIICVPGHDFDFFFGAMIVCFYVTSHLGGTLLSETVSSLNCYPFPKLIDFAGVGVCGLTTWGFYFATTVCLLIISEKTPPESRYAAATLMIHGTYLFTVISGVLTIGFFLLSCHRLITCAGAGGDVLIDYPRTIPHPQHRRGTLGSDLYRFLIITIFLAILYLVRG